MIEKQPYITDEIFTILKLLTQNFMFKDQNEKLNFWTDESSWCQVYYCQYHTSDPKQHITAGICDLKWHITNDICDPKLVSRVQSGGKEEQMLGGKRAVGFVASSRLDFFKMIFFTFPLALMFSKWKLTFHIFLVQFVAQISLESNANTANNFVCHHKKAILSHCQ